MKASAVVIVMILVLAVAQPAAARPHDPESFAYPHRICVAGEQTDASGRVICRPLPTNGAGTGYVSWSPREARALLASARSAIAAARALEYRLDMQPTMTNIRGGAWASESTLTGAYTAPDRLRGVLIITNRWATTQSQVLIAEGAGAMRRTLSASWRH